jgi:hypothetical protein
MTEALLLGRKTATLTPEQPTRVRDALFQADRVDGQKFEGAHFEHCTFANVSFKDAILSGCTFENCAFIDCYFRQAVVDSTRFLGSKFISSDFPKTSFRQCSFVYVQFRACFIPYDEFESSLPEEPNLRRLLGENLAREAEAAGATRDARLYRLRAHEAFEQYLWRGFVGADVWSREHFPGLPDRALAGVRLAGRWVNRVVWGYGDRGSVLLRNAVLLTFGLFPLLFYFARHGLAQTHGKLGTSSYFFLSVDNLLSRTGFSGVDATTRLARSLIGLEVLLGLIFIGLAVTLLFRWITRR